ncbi:MAG: PEGA domain-containing protein [Polyangiaceae bacterium]|nr:PEGA domain-containing protein [Polyangiaceae bacterium]
MTRSAISEGRHRARLADRRASSRLRCGAALGAMLAGLLGALEASADPPQSPVPDPAAEALFRSGRDLVEKGDWAAGCPKFEASLELYISASTLLNIARCHEHHNKLASAWAAYRRALVVNKETPGVERRNALEEVARKGLAALEPRLPKLRIVIPVAPERLEVTRNGQYVPLGMLGTSIPVDPGEHTIQVRAPGYRTERRSVKVAEGKTARIEIALILGEGGDDFEGDANARSSGNFIPTWSIAVGAGGLALLTAAAIFRVDQALIEGRQHGICHGDVENRCPPTYVPDADNARKNRDFGLFVGLGSAGVLALGAAVIGAALSSPEEDEFSAGAFVGPEGGGASLHGRF